SLFGQTLCAVLHDQARGRRGGRLRRDQAAQVRRVAAGVEDRVDARHPSSDLSLFKRKLTFSLKGRREDGRLMEAASPLGEGEGLASTCASISSVSSRP